MAASRLAKLTPSWYVIIPPLLSPEAYSRVVSTQRSSSRVSKRPGMKPPTLLVPVPVGVISSSQVVQSHCGVSLHGEHEL
jgi:hypothetical protein